MSTQDIPTTGTGWRAELQRLVQAYDDHGGKWPDEDVEALYNAFTRARAALAQPEPVGPTVMEIIALAFEIEEEGLGQIDLVRRALARWGRPAIQPISVAERLPGPEDCAPWPDEPNATPWAWAAKCTYGECEWVQLSMLWLGSNTLGRIIAGGGWTHWLPAHALPIPTRQED
jgi:hypothetical protein